MINNEKIFEQNINLVRFVMKKLNIELNDKLYEDLFQEGCIGLWKACEQYEKNKAKFSTFACKCIENQILMFFKTKTKENKLKIISLEKIVYDEKDNDIHLYETIETDYSKETDFYIQKVFDLLKNEDIKNKDLLIKYMDGKTIRQLAKEEKISATTISRKILLAMNNLRDLVDKDIIFRK